MFKTQNLSPLMDREGGCSRPGFLHTLGQVGNWGKEIGEFLTLGRDHSNEVQLDDPWVSGRHARIEKTPLGHRLRDLRSRNGTYLNGAIVFEALLCEGDRIQLGRTQFIYSHTRNPNENETLLESKNPEWAKTLSLIPNMATSDLPVLILGESGTGKEILANSLHKLSGRKHSPFISVNCSALSESLIESELFGHTKGAFTGATSDRKGAFEEARGGTLFLDEIGDLPINLQPKLLRALENHEIKPVGSDKNIKTDVRIVAATHSKLRDKVQTGEFRLDLYFRLNVIQIKTLNLADRMEDFEDLVAQFAKREKIALSKLAIERLKAHDWPGNIRELKNSISRAKAYFGNQVHTIEEVDLLLDQNSDSPPKRTKSSIKTSEGKDQPVSIIKGLEYELIRDRLIANNGNQRRTALDLGIPKSTLHDRLKTYGIKIEKLRF